jgi:hypothetical protein
MMALKNPLPQFNLHVSPFQLFHQGGIRQDLFRLKRIGKNLFRKLLQGQGFDKIGHTAVFFPGHLRKFLINIVA